MGYTPENNPYIPGDPYSYDLKWMVEEINEAKAVREIADQAASVAQQAADNAYTSANKAEAWAIGYYEGDPVQPGEPQYENNAKYYAESAAADAATIAEDLTELPSIKTRLTNAEIDISVLDSRVDQFASLPAGSTAGNAELLDIRIGAYGEEYPSAGDAVRGQIRAIDDDLYNINVDDIEIEQLISSVLASLPNATYKWLFGIVPANSFVSSMKVVVQGNSTAIVELEKWEYDEATQKFTLAETVTAGSIEAYADAPGNYLLDFGTFHTTKRTMLTFSDTSSAGWVRYYNTPGVNIQRFSNSLSAVEDDDIVTQSNVEALYELKYVAITKTKKYNVAVVDPAGNGDFTTISAAISATAENTPIYVMPGVYDEEIDVRTKRIILIGADRNTCILRSTDGRYDHAPLYASCGYFENMTFYAEYVSGVSYELAYNENGAYGVHIDADNDYAVGKRIEFHHCNLMSDFFPGLGLGLRKNAPVIIDDCNIVSGQIFSRGTYSQIGGLGALYFHDTNGATGDQEITVKNCTIIAALQHALTILQVNNTGTVKCNFISNVIKGSTGYSNNIWYRNDPFNTVTGIFKLNIGFNNTNSDLNE